MQEKQTVLTEQKAEAKLPGAWERFRYAGQSGNHEDGYGVGEISLQLRRMNEDWPWIDLGQIYFSNPTAEQYMDAETSPVGTEGRIAYANIRRRLSKKQAELIVKKISQMITLEFPNGIPPDDEI